MDKQIKLMSLFDGSGGFCLAGALHGIVPVSSSEIEPFCLNVEAARFPNCKQLGSVTDINGAEVEPVDIITFGSPCQDLSVAGKQAGIHDGERSNLFFEAIRIIKEMRNATADKFPRFAVWENVPGAFSSNRGGDFQAVLKAFCSVRNPSADVPRPADGVWQPAGCVLGNDYSIAWRVLDAQYSGVHNAVKESTLSQILQLDAPERYSLSPTACAGIIRRAEKRGKELPLMLRDALMEVIGRAGGIESIAEEPEEEEQDTEEIDDEDF